MDKVLRRAIGYVWLEAAVFGSVAGIGYLSVSAKRLWLVNKIGVCYLGEIPETKWDYWIGIPLCVIVFGLLVKTLWINKLTKPLARLLLIVLVLEVGVIATPFYLVGGLHLVHNSIATTMFVVEWLTATWLTFRKRFDNWTGLLWFVQSAASILAGVTFIDLAWQMYLGQVLTQISFIGLLLRHMYIERRSYR
jgi:hypothetical protein